VQAVKGPAVGGAGGGALGHHVDHPTRLAQGVCVCGGGGGRSVGTLRSMQRFAGERGGGAWIMHVVHTVVGEGVSVGGAEV
jgi:hypothetical protein